MTTAQHIHSRSGTLAGDVPHMTPVPRLRALRTRAALSQRDLAEAAHVALSTVVALESGQQGARPSTIRRLASALNVQPADLMGADHSGDAER